MAVRKLSLLCWESFDGLSASQKQGFLQPYLQTREPIRRFSDIQKGDHLVRKVKRQTISSLPGSLRPLLEFEHHFLCINRDYEDKRVIIHYYILMKDAVGSGIHLGGTGEVQVMTLPHKDFIKNEEELQWQGGEIERVLWPVHLWRYSLEEVIRRAHLRDGEQRYDLTQNNCENFVMWCICGANVSLQATPKRAAWWEVIKAPFFALDRHVPMYALMKFWNSRLVLDTRGGGLQVRVESLCNGSLGKPEFQNGINLLLTTVVEIKLAVSRDIYSCWRELEDGVITSREYQDKVSEILISCLFRVSGGYLGMIITEEVCLHDQSVLRVLIGTYSGVASGHLVGQLVVRYNILWLKNLSTWIVKKDVKMFSPRPSTNSQRANDWRFYIGFGFFVYAYAVIQSDRHIHSDQVAFDLGLGLMTFSPQVSRIHPLLGLGVFFSRLVVPRTVRKIIILAHCGIIRFANYFFA